jgi:ankyrin repeat protein
MEPSGDTLLGIAIDSGSTDMVTLLLDARADVNQINSAGQLPLVISYTYIPCSMIHYLWCICIDSKLSSW